MIDRYDLSVALQLWQRFFSLALGASLASDFGPSLVSNSEAMWAQHRASALEYLARGKMMAVASLFLDGPVVHEDGDVDLYKAAQRGVAIALGVGSDDPDVSGAAAQTLRSMVAELEAAETELRKLLADRCAYIALDAGQVELELSRVPEMTPEHRAWMRSPLAAARGAVVAAELERPAMPPTSSAPAENPGVSAFFRQSAPADNPNPDGVSRFFAQPSEGPAALYAPATPTPLYAQGAPSSPAAPAAPSAPTEPAPAEPSGGEPAPAPAAELEPETENKGFHPGAFPAPPAARVPHGAKPPAGALEHARRKKTPPDEAG